MADTKGLQEGEYSRQENQSSDVDNAVRLTKQQYSGRKISREGLKEIVKGAIAIESAEQRRKDEAILDKLFSKPSSCLPQEKTNNEKPIGNECYSIEQLERVLGSISKEVGISGHALETALRDYDKKKLEEIQDARQLIRDDNKRKAKRRQLWTDIKYFFLGAWHINFLPTLIRKGVQETVEDYSNIAYTDCDCDGRGTDFLMGTFAAGVTNFFVGMNALAELKHGNYMWCLPGAFLLAGNAISLGRELGRLGYHEIKRKLDVRKARKLLRQEGEI